MASFFLTVLAFSGSEDLMSTKTCQKLFKVFKLKPTRASAVFKSMKYMKKIYSNDINFGKSCMIFQKLLSLKTNTIDCFRCTFQNPFHLHLHPFLQLFAVSLVTAYHFIYHL